MGAVSLQPGFSFAIEGWAAWAPGLEDRQLWLEWDGGPLPHIDRVTPPPLSFIDKMVRRRISLLPAMALHVSHQLLNGEHGVGFVYGSRHGDLQRSTSLLKILAQREMPSPTSFSLSVHNSTAGLYSITRGEKSPSTAIAAGEETFLWALAEATMQIRSGLHDKVLVVVCDAELPEEYRSQLEPGDSSWAVALLIRAGDNIRVRTTSASGEYGGELPLPLRFLAWWLQGENSRFLWSGERIAMESLRHMESL